MRNRIDDEDFKLDRVKYYAEHLELSQAEAAKKSQCTGKNIKQMACYLTQHCRKIGRPAAEN